MADIEIHELITAEDISSSDVIADQRESAGTWLTRKLTLNALGLFLLNELDYSSDLHTTSKKVIGAINELKDGVSAVSIGTTAPSDSQGNDRNLYIQYDANDYSVVAMYVKIEDSWRPIELGDGGESQCGAFVDYTDLITTVTFANGSASYTAITDCYAIIRGYYVDNTTAIQIKVDGVLERGSSRVGSAIEPTTFVATSVLLKKGQTLTVENCLSTTNDNYIKIYGLQYSSPNLQPVIYSEEEREIGVWIDGKPVYEKTQYISALPSSVGDWVNYPHGISNFDRLISVSATAYSSNVTQQLNIPHVYATGGTPTMVGQIAISVSDTNIAFIVGNDRSSWEAYVTIQYTKTTDAPGSGTWTPQGVPAVHYSTDERIVGTWIDGSPVYEKSFSVTSPLENVPTNIIEITSLSVDDVVSLEGVINAVSNAIYIGNTDWRMWTRMNWESTNKDYIACNITNAAYASQPLVVTIRYTKSST